jgi:BON domain
MTAIRRLLYATSVATALCSSIRAGETAPTGPEDPILNRVAYSALQHDAALADLNIGVRVLKGGTAVLWGTANKADAAKAEALLKTVPGITSVVNSCDAAGAPDPLVARVEAEVKRIVLPSDLPDKPKIETVKADPPAIAAPLSPSAPVSRHTTMVEKPLGDELNRRAPATHLGDPVAVTNGTPVDYSAIERARRADSRFARLTFDLRDGRVVIGGSATDPAIAWELAKKVAPLIGDRDVVVGRIGR